MHSIEAVSNTSCCQIVSIAEFGSRKAEEAARMEKWLEERAVEEYGDVYVAQNPLIRIFIKFQALAEDSQL